MEVRKKSLKKAWHVGYVLLAMMFIINNSASVNDTPKGVPEDTLCSSVGKFNMLKKTP